MWKKAAALLGMILLAVLANTKVACRVTVANQTVDGLYSPTAVDRALTAAEAAAEEIVRGKAELPRWNAGMYSASPRPKRISAR